MNRLERLLLLLPWLNSHQGSSISEIAEAFGVSEKQIEQDILMFSVTGSGQFYGEQFSVDWDDDRVYVYDSLGLDRPVKFDTAEAATLLLGLDAISTVPGIDLHAVESAKTKLKNVLPLASNLKVEVDASSTEIELLQRARADGKRIGFDYWNSGRDDFTRRDCSPVRVYFRDGINYVDGYCHTSEGWRTFRLDRMENLSIAAEDIDVPEREFLPMELEVVRLSVPQSHESLLEEFSVASKQNEAGVTTAEVRVFGFAWLVRKIVASGGTITVVQPQSVQEMARKAASEGLAAYDSE